MQENEVRPNIEDRSRKNIEDVPEVENSKRLLKAWDDLCLRLYGEIVTDTVAHALRHAANEVIGELRAEIGRLKGEIDQMQADHTR